MRASISNPLFLFLTLISIFKIGYSSKQIYTLVFVQTYTAFHPEYLSGYDITILPKAPGSAINVNIGIIRNLTLDPMLQIMVSMKMNKNDKNFRNIYTFDFDYCKFFRYGDGRSKKAFDMNVGNVLEIWAKNVEKYGKLPTCPISEGSYSIKNFRVDKNSIPSFATFGKYRVNVTSYFKDKKQKMILTNGALDIDVRKKTVH